jgi:hypothetical protein
MEEAHAPIPNKDSAVGVLVEVCCGHVATVVRYVTAFYPSGAVEILSGTYSEALGCALRLRGQCAARSVSCALASDTEICMAIPHGPAMVQNVCVWIKIECGINENRLLFWLSEILTKCTFT